MEIARWLAGGAKHNRWLPDDRMPPLSYWAGWLWSRAFGLAEAPMRWFSVACAALATGLVFAGANRTWGLASGLTAGLLLGLSPGVIDQAVEVRSYALFLLESAAAFTCLTALLSGPVHGASRWLMLMTMCGIAAMYTHFYGLILSGGCLLAALALLPRRGGRADQVLAAIAVTGIAALGLLPFVTASFHQSGLPLPASKLRLVAQWAYRLYSHPTISLSPLEEGWAALGFALAGAVALHLASRRPLTSGAAAAGLVLALGAGAVVTLLGLFLLKSLIATKISYSVWMLPALAMFLSSGLAERPGRCPWWSLLGIVLLLATYGIALGQRVAYGEWFTHAPMKRLTSLIDTLGPERVAVIYEGDRDAMLYFPVYYSFRDAVKQYVFQDQVSGKVELKPYPPMGTRAGLEDLSAEALIVVRSDDQRSSDLVRQLHHGLETLGAGPVTRALSKSAHWRLTEHKSYRAFLGVDIHVFERVSLP